MCREVQNDPADALCHDTTDSVHICMMFPQICRPSRVPFARSAQRASTPLVWLVVVILQKKKQKVRSN